MQICSCTINSKVVTIFFHFKQTDSECYRERDVESTKNFYHKNNRFEVVSLETMMVRLTDAENNQVSQDANTKNNNDKIKSVESYSVSGEDIPPHPPKTKKRDIVPDITVFKQLDEHALSAPSSLRSSLCELAYYLVKPATNNLERVRVFYRWITDNIRYDTEGQVGGINSCDPNEVLKTGKSVGLGYADLFSAFCRVVNIPVHTIKGHAKGYNHNPETVLTPSTKPNHAWNVVLLDGYWRFIECMWGSGHLKEQTFNKHFTEFYFLTDPDLFISEHYPCTKYRKERDSKWQLLDKPISVIEFVTRVKLSSTALEYGVIPMSHKSGVIELKSDDTISIQDEHGNIENWLINFSLSDGTDMNNYAMSYISNLTTLKIIVRPPSAEKYVLKIFAKPIGKETAAHTLLLKYIIKCTDPAVHVKPFPTRKTPWAYCPEYKEYGFAEESRAIPIFTANDGNLAINIPTTRQVEAMAKLHHAQDKDVSLENCTLVESLDNEIVIRARLPIEGFYALDIMAKRPWEESNTYRSSIAYLIDCPRPMSPCYPFPHCYYGAITKYKCRLLEPLKGSLPPKSSLVFRLESKILQRIKVLKQNLKRGGDDIFEGEVDIPDTGIITVSGSDKDSGPLSCLYRFSVAN
ncbi:hypothetical protein CHS0354_040422 [Potamilus streckersoni]|uniref:Transglutaminase-like domain-containing protein n=1 Tax=Potamilus streckersoni TaxID=2493646 RepID=A0AAE0W4X9_9BIVA|nr:hypothetical protein CHS0354_040422 [Potamilus streckersoni]